MRSAETYTKDFYPSTRREVRTHLRDTRRFWNKVQRGPRKQCWLWAGSTLVSKGVGYGKFLLGGRYVVAHRVSYILVIGNIPRGRIPLDHFRCDNPPCVNPYHVHPTTPLDNLLRGNSAAAINARRRECTHGHPLRGYNLMVFRLKNGRLMRQCRECKKRYR